MSEITVAGLTHQLQRLRPEEQLDWLANHPQAKGLVPALSPLVLHRLAHELGGHELAGLLPHCSEDQMRSLVDLSTWNAQAFEFRSFEGWLMLNLQVGGSQLDRFLTALDREQLLLYLAGRIRVHEIDEDEKYPTLANAVPGDALWFSPDRRFCVEISNWQKDEDDEAIRLLLRHWEGRDAFELSRLLAALAWELETNLHEESLRLRNARLEELGFPPWEEAQVLYAAAPLDVLLAAKRAVVLRTAPSHGGVTLLSGPGPRDLLRQAQDAMDPTAASSFAAELVYLANRALVADACDPGDLTALAEQSRRVRATVTLGLEFLARRAGGELSVAAAGVMERYPCSTLFRLGVNLVRPLRDLAQHLVDDPRSGPEQEVSWLGKKARSVIQNALKKRPLAADGEPIGDLATVQLMGEALEETMALMEAVFEDGELLTEFYGAELDGSNMSRLSDFSLEGLARTREALDVLGLTGQLRAIRVEELPVIKAEAPKDEPLARLLAGPLEPRFLLPLWCELES